MIIANRGVSTTVKSGHGLGGDTKTATSEYTLTGALTAAQVIEMLALPAGARIIDCKVSLDTITGGTFSVGDRTTPARFVSAAAAGTRLALNDLHLYATPTIIVVTVATAPTGTTGKLRLWVSYVIDGVPYQ